jgi:hypothetical protein
MFVALLAAAFVVAVHGAGEGQGQHEEQVLSVGNHHACVIEQTVGSGISGEIVCWGINDEQELDAPAVSARVGAITICVHD